jgi:hypothetical protein
MWTYCGDSWGDARVGRTVYFLIQTGESCTGYFLVLHLVLRVGAATLDEVQLHSTVFTASQ